MTEQYAQRQKRLAALKRNLTNHTKVTKDFKATHFNGTSSSRPLALSETLNNEIDSGLNRSKLVFWHGGSQRNEIMIIGEAPGQQEASSGKPFYYKAPSGKLLREWFSDSFSEERPEKRYKAQNLKKLFEEAHVTNVVKIRPFVEDRIGKRTDRQPTSFEIAEFLPYLKKEVVECQPKIVFCAGAIAYTALMNNLSVGRFLLDPKYENDPELVRKDYSEGNLPKGEILKKHTEDKEHDYIKIEGVEHVIWVVYLPHPSYVLRSQQKLVLSRTIHKVILDAISGLGTDNLLSPVFEPLRVLHDYSRSELESYYKQYSQQLDNSSAEKREIVEKLLNIKLQQEDNISKSEIHKEIMYSGACKEDVESGSVKWSRSEQIFHQRPRTQTLKEIHEQSTYNIRMDDLRYDFLNNCFEICGRSHYGDSIFLQAYPDPTINQLEEWKTFRFIGYSRPPECIREFLLDPTSITKQKRIHDCMSPYFSRNKIDFHPFLIRFQNAWKMEEMKRALVDTNVNQQTIKNSTPVKTFKISDLEEMYMEKDDDKMDICSEDADSTTKRSSRNSFEDIGDESGGYITEFDTETELALELLDLWSKVINIALLEKGCITRMPTREEISVSWKRYKSSRDLHTRYDDIPVWVEMRVLNYKLFKDVNSTIKEMPMVIQQNTPMQFAEFINSPIRHFTLNTGIDAETWLFLDPKKANFNYIRGNTQPLGWLPEEMSRITSKDVHITCSTDILFPSVPKKQWNIAGKKYSLSYDIEMDGTKELKFPTPRTASIITICVDLQLCDDSMVIVDKGINRSNTTYCFTLRNCKEGDLYYAGSNIASDVKYPMKVNVFKFKSEYELLRGYAHFLYQVGPDRIIGHNNREFDDIQVFNRSRLGGIIYGYNVPALGCKPRFRNLIEIQMFSSAAYQTQKMHLLRTAGGLVIDDTRAVYFREVKLTDYKLNTCAAAVLGDSKEEMPWNAIGGYHWGDPDDNWLVISYCIKDCKLPQQLFNRDRWDLKFAALCQEAGDTFSNVATVKGAQPYCDGSLNRHIYRPYGLDESNPRAVQREYLIVDFKNTITSSTLTLEQIAQINAESIGSSNTNESSSESGADNSNLTGVNSQTSETIKMLDKYRKLLKNNSEEGSLGFADSRNVSKTKEVGQIISDVAKRLSKNQSYVSERGAKSSSYTSNNNTKTFPSNLSSKKQQVSSSLGKRSNTTHSSKSNYDDDNEKLSSIKRVKPNEDGKGKKKTVSFGKETTSKEDGTKKGEHNFKSYQCGHFNVKETCFKVEDLSDTDATLLRPNINPVTGETTYESVVINHKGKYKNLQEVIKELSEQAKKKVKGDRLKYLQQSYEGAVVFDIAIGFCRIAIITLDFSSLYPSIMIAYNKSTETMCTLSEIIKRSIKVSDFYECPCPGVPTRYLNNIDIMQNKEQREKYSEPSFCLRQYYMLTVYSGQSDLGWYKPDSLLRVCAENVERISKMRTTYFDGERYLEWFCTRYGLGSPKDIGDDFTLPNKRTGKDDIIYLCTNDKMGQGLVPKTSVALIDLRNQAKREMKLAAGTYFVAQYDGRQLAFKKIGNSTYGFAAAKGSNFYQMLIASNTTKIGQIAIIKSVEVSDLHFKDPNFPLNEGFTQQEIDEFSRLLGGDTDSSFSSYVFAKHIEEAMEFGEKQAAFIEQLKLFMLPIIFAFEKVYPYGLFTAKKHYVAPKSEPAANGDVFKKKRFIEINPDLFPVERWEEFFSMRKKDTLKISLTDSKALETELVDPNYISHSLKESKEVFFNVFIDSDGNRIVEEIVKSYQYYEVVKTGKIAWWEPGVLVDAKGTLYTGDVWFQSLDKHTKKLLSLSWEDYKTHFRLPRYKGHHFNPMDHVKIFARGIETVRRSSDKYLKETLDKFLKLILLEGKYTEAALYVQQRASELINGRVPIYQLIFTANYGKTEYKTETGHIHAIRCIKEDPNCGIPIPSIGDRVSYIVTYSPDKGRKSSERCFHPEMARKRHLKPDYVWYFNRFTKSIKVYLDHFFDSEFSRTVLNEENLLEKHRVTSLSMLQPVGKLIYKEVKTCSSCGTRQGVTEKNLLCQTCADEVYWISDSSDYSSKKRKDFLTKNSEYEKCMDICRKCTKTATAPCCSFDCYNFDPRMSSKFKLDTLHNELRGVYHQISTHIPSQGSEDYYSAVKSALSDW